MKRFFLVSLLMTAVIAAWACVEERIDRYYIYYLPDSDSWTDRKYDAMAAEWTRLLGTPITVNDVRNIPDHQDAITRDSYSKIARICSDGRHPEELAYLRLIADIAKESRFSYDSWDYPTKEEIALHESNLSSIRNRVRTYKGSRLAPQYRLQEMRMSFALKDWADCERLWRNAPKDDSIFTEMMRNLYAGVLYRTGRKDEAFAIYSEMGDTESASWCAARTGSVDGIVNFYDTDPDSKVLPYLIRQFCNNTQETLDMIASSSDGSYEAKWLEEIGAREINRTEAEKFLALADKAAANPKVSDKAMWLGAAALVEYYYGNFKEAARLMAKAESAPASEQSKMACKYIAIFVDIANAPADKVSDMAADDVIWLMEDCKNPHSGRMLHRLVYTELKERLNDDAGLFPLMAATAADGLCKADLPADFKYSGDYSSDYFAMLDSIPVEKLKEWYAINSTRRLGKWTPVLNALNTDPYYLKDIIGTRLMRQGRWAEAREYLADIPCSFLSKQNISPFAAKRDFKLLPWLTPREVVKDEWEPTKVTRNAKLDFCDYVMGLERNQRTREDALRLAAAYYNASEYGKCWWLTDYSWTSCSDTISDNGPDRDFAAEARAIVKKAYSKPGKTSPVELKFAETYVGKDPLTKYDSNLERSVYLKTGDYYRGLSEIADMLRGTPQSSWPAEIRRCDVFRQFMKTER